MVKAPLTGTLRCSKAARRNLLSFRPRTGALISNGLNTPSANGTLRSVLSPMPRMAAGPSAVLSRALPL